jgi:hypothetical protein
MNDRTMKILLVLIVVLLALLLVRPAAVTPKAMAQAGLPAAANGPAMATGNNLVYVLKGDELSVFYVDLGLRNPFEAMKLLGDPKEQDEIFKSANLRLLLRQDIKQLQPVAKNAQ